MLKRGITLGELISTCIVLGGAILGFWINTNVRLSALEINQENERNYHIELKEINKEIIHKIDKIGDNVNELKVNKEDRRR